MTRTQLKIITKKLREYARFLDAPFWQQDSLPLSQENPFEWAFVMGANENAILVDIQDIVSDAGDWIEQMEQEEE